MSKQLALTVINGFNRQPAMLSPAYADTLVQTIQNLTAANAKEENEWAQENVAVMLSSYGYGSSADSKPFAYADGIAFIPVSGLLINRFSQSWGWVTGYNFIRAQLDAAMEDEDVKLVVFDVNSGGGMVHGCFELADAIYASRDIKPSVAVIDSNCYSAAYAIGSSATRMYITPSGGAGSIGTLNMHIDYSKAMADWGLKVTLTFSGDHKADGNPYEPLPESVKAELQKTLDGIRAEFVALVARNRGLDAQAVYDTEAQCYSATEAIALGLIDSIAPPLEAVSEFLIELSGSETDKENEMSKEKETPGADGANTAQPIVAAEVAAPAAAAAEPAAPVAAAPATDAKAAVTAERQRISAIQSCEEATDKAALANHLALNTELSVDDAKAILKAAPAGAKATAANPLEVAMTTTANPNVGADAAAAGEGGEQTDAQRILAAQQLATGVKPVVH